MVRCLRFSQTHGALCISLCWIWLTIIIGNDNKGKGKLSIDDVTEERVGTSSGSTVSTSPIVPGNQFQASDDPKRITRSSATQNRGFRERFQDIAKQNASRFAHFPSAEEEDNHIADGLEGEPSGVVNNEAEDWPGLFSTAKRIIEDRQTKASMQQSLLKSASTPIVWNHKKDLKSNIKKNLVPSLVDICLYSISENVDAISSLDYVPDVLRHRLFDLLCDSRKIDEHFLGLLVHGTPTEIHVRECSWINEEIFIKTFSGCDMSNLAVLQLDQCGASMPDYILSSTLAHSPNCLPSLTSLCLVGAYRLSDVGLSLLAASAPALRSINLSQCSLITFDAIHCLASSIGSVLMELYIDECQGIDAMIILPALLQFQNLEVLSFTNIGSVSVKFINKFVPVRGHNMKELVLRNCVDEAVAAYIETCGEPLRELSLSNVSTVDHNTATSLARHSKNLHSLDLSWCRKLTDEAFGFIVDSCTTLKMLKVFGCTQEKSNVEIPPIHLANSKKDTSLCQKRKNVPCAPTSTKPVKKKAHQMQQLHLLSWYKTEKIVAIGELASKDPDDKVHCIPLGPHCWKVWVREVIEDIALSRPTEEFNTLSEAKGSTVAWPSRCIKLL